MITAATERGKMTKYIDVEWMKDNLINRGFNEFVKNGGYPTSYSLMDFIEILNHSPAVDIPQWISVTKRLPEEDKEVLISYRYKEGEGDTSHVKIDITSYGQMYFGGNKVGKTKHWRAPFEYFESNYEVIAWMPLPEPYKGGEEK